MNYTNPLQVVAISGSTRQQSTNHNLLQAIAQLANDQFSVLFFDGLESLPQFNPDYALDNVPQQVEAFRQLLDKADGILLCTPEYAHGVPGSLKNAIDWTVSTNQFYHKPTALITASTDGSYAHKALLETLQVIEAASVAELQLLISFAQTKVTKQYQVTDEPTLVQVQQLINRFTAVMQKSRKEKI